MWQRTKCPCLLLLLVITGSLKASNNMWVSPVVTVSRGGNAILACSFTHPQQQHYSGKIIVRWLARRSNAEPFFTCSLKNESTVELAQCSDSRLRHSLVGDPRRGELSLLIREVRMGDNGSFFCQVELDRQLKYQKESQLYVTVQPRILSLDIKPGSNSTTRRLRCEAEGHPLPTITWLFASGRVLEDQIQTSVMGPDRLESCVPHLEEDVVTCVAESRLGRAEKSYPSSNTAMITLSVCGLAVLLLLLLTGLIIFSRRRARANTPHVYENAEEVKSHRLRGSNSPAENNVELQPVYTDIIQTSQRAAFQSSTQEDTGIFYSPVNVSHE